MRCQKASFRFVLVLLLSMLCFSTQVLAAEETSFTAEESAYIRTAAVLKIGYQPGRAPSEFYDQKTKKAQGINIELLRYIQELSGLKFEFVLTDSVQDAIKKIQAGKLDFTIGIAQNQNYASSCELVLTKPILRSKLTFIQKKGSLNFEGINQNTILAIPKDWLGIQKQLQENYPIEKILYYDTLEECLDAVVRGAASLTVQNAMAVEQTLRSHQYRELAVNSMRNSDFPVCLAASEQVSPLLLSVMNQAIEAITPEILEQAIYKYTIAMPYHPSFNDSLFYSMPLILVGSAVFCMILLCFSLYSRKKLNQLAYYDPLTGEMNLNRFKREAQKLMSNHSKNYAIMVLDIDKFKSINNLYGYEFGDHILVLVAQALRQCLQPGSVLCHGVADKFYYLFENQDSVWLDEQFKMMVKCVEETVHSEIPSCKIVMSAGVCAIRPEDENIIAIIDRANVASRQVKSYHESSFALYDQSMYDKINSARTIENEMSAALDKNEFVVYLQPKIRLSTREIAGAEALVRWIHPEKGLISPGEFIPLFEENGFIVTLDYYMLEQVCRLLEKWKREGRSLFPISVNLSRRHLQNVGTAKILSGIVSHYDVSPSLIEIELTESAFDNCNVRAMNVLFDELHQYGFTVSVDDFGTGYSSLSLLKDLPIDVLKIDKSFFDEANSSADKMGLLLESVLSLSRKLHIRTVSEGVETQEQIDMLLEFGCELVQGFYFARPMPVTALEALLKVGSFFEGKK